MENIDGSFMSKITWTSFRGSLRSLRRKLGKLNHLDFLFGCFGPPVIFKVDDNGTEFIAEVVVTLAKKWGIKLINGGPRRPQT